MYLREKKNELFLKSKRFQLKITHIGCKENKINQLNQMNSLPPLSPFNASFLKSSKIFAFFFILFSVEFVSYIAQLRDTDPKLFQLYINLLDQYRQLLINLYSYQPKNYRHLIMAKGYLAKMWYDIFNNQDENKFEIKYIDNYSSQK